MNGKSHSQIPPALADLENLSAGDLDDLEAPPAATPPETPPARSQELTPTTPPLSFSHASGRKTPAHADGGDLLSLMDKRVAGILGLVQTSNERLETREGVFAELCQMFRETIAETRTIMKLWERQIAALDDLEEGMSQSTAALVKVHQELMQALDRQH